MGERRNVGSPPDDGGHVGSDTTPDQTIVTRELGEHPTPELARDRSKVIERTKLGPLPWILGITLLLVFLILMVFMPRS